MINIYINDIHFPFNIFKVRVYFYWYDQGSIIFLKNVEQNICRVGFPYKLNRS